MPIDAVCDIWCLRINVTIRAVIVKIMLPLAGKICRNWFFMSTVNTFWSLCSNLLECVECLCEENYCRDLSNSYLYLLVSVLNFYPVSLARKWRRKLRRRRWVQRPKRRALDPSRLASGRAMCWNWLSLSQNQRWNTTSAWMRKTCWTRAGKFAMKFLGARILHLAWVH